jgi:hypothetical protein
VIELEKKDWNFTCKEKEDKRVGLQLRTIKDKGGMVVDDTRRFIKSTCGIVGFFKKNIFF